MFKTNPDSMRMEPTPERVLSVCRLVAHKKMTHEEVRTAMTLGHNGDKELDQINKSIKVALEELSLIKSKDNYLELAVSEGFVASSDSFRHYVASKAFSQKDSTFVMFSKWVINQNERIFKLRNWEGMAATCKSEVAELNKLDENAVLGWRFWAAFLGLGYLNGTMILPNMKLRLQDLLATSFSQTFEYDTVIRATDFVLWLDSKMPEADLSGKLPLAVSAGLRTLNELELISMETWQDSNRIMLYYIDGDPVNEFSHITVRKKVCE